MEDSFRVRVDKAFGALAAAPSSESILDSNLRSLWSLTDDEIEKREWNRTKDDIQEIELDSRSSSFMDCNTKQSDGSSSRRRFKDDFEKDLEDFDEKGDEEGEEDVDVDAECAQRSSKPEDYDDEKWEIKSNIGRDCTLDYEEEEDAYDKQAIGKEKSADRVFMKDITDDGVDIDSDNVLPTSFQDFVRDPRANHLAAKIRLREDSDAANKLNAFHVSEKVERDDDEGKPKSILKRKDVQSDWKSQKRARFGPDCDDKGNDPSDGDRDSSMETSSMEDQIMISNGNSSAQIRSQRFQLAVPDYLQNPSRYTRYSLDSEGDMDEESNKRAYMDFMKLINKSNSSEELEKEADLPSVTFISKKKSSGEIMVVGSASVTNQDNGNTIKEALVNKKSMPVVVAAATDGDIDVSAMEEDQPQAPAIEERRNTSVKSNRQYRKKAKEEHDELKTQFL